MHGSLWHAAKVALVRDAAERVLNEKPTATDSSEDASSHGVASRLLTAEELARFEHDAAADEV